MTIMEHLTMPQAIKAWMDDARSHWAVLRMDAITQRDHVGQHNRGVKRDSVGDPLRAVPSEEPSSSSTGGGPSPPNRTKGGRNAQEVLAQGRAAKRA